MVVENLCFAGGGCKAPIYGGVIKALEEKGLIKNIKRCSGTSAGSIIATLVCIGYNADEIKIILDTLDFKSFKSGFNPLRLLTKYGIYDGDNFIKWLKDVLVKKGLDKNITFEQLHELSLTNNNYKDLYIFAANLNQKNIIGFSYTRNGSVRIIDAVRASMSIPLFFKTWKIKQFPDELFVDGGVAYNYPISVFDNEEFLSKEDLKRKDFYNSKSLGFFLNTLDNKPKKVDLKYFEIVKYLSCLINTLIDGEVINLKRRKQDIKRTVFINNLGISATDFDITKEEINNLYKSGYDATINYLMDK